MNKRFKNPGLWNVKCFVRLFVLFCFILVTIGRPINTASQTYAEADITAETIASSVPDAKTDGGSGSGADDIIEVLSMDKYIFDFSADFDATPDNIADFTDLRAWYWAYTDIINLTSLGLIDGYSDGEFKPEQPITRGEFAMLLSRTLYIASRADAAIELLEKIPPFGEPVIYYTVQDLDEDDPIYPYAAAVEEYFQPRRVRGSGWFYEADSPLLRSEAAEALVRLLGLQNNPVEDSALDIFTDADSIDSRTVRRFAALAAQNGIFLGAEGNTLDMDGYVGRAEACALLCRAIRMALWAETIEFPSQRIYVPDADSGFYSTFFNDAVFVGDSITQGLGIYALSQRSRGNSPLGSARFLTAVSYSIRASASDNYANNAINLSWQGQKMSIEECLAAMGAKELYIMLGVNDGVGSNLEYYRDLYQKAMDKVTARNPELVIRVQSCTPITKSREKGVLNNENLDRFNVLLKEICEVSGYDYVDVSTPMKRGDGSLKPEYSSDMYVHMSSEGSVVWINALYAFAREKYIGGEWSPSIDPEEYPGIWIDVIR